MQIESFDQGPNRKVILHMVEMPDGMKYDNTSITVAGIGQDPPTSFSRSDQQITFTASQNAQKGRIGVLADLDDGTQVTAQSTQDYEPGNEGDPYMFSARSIMPGSASPGDWVAIRGRNLSKVIAVSLGNVPVPGKPIAAETIVKFIVPTTTQRDTYQIKIKALKPDGTPMPFVSTNLRLNVTRKG